MRKPRPPHDPLAVAMAALALDRIDRAAPARVACLQMRGVVHRIPPHPVATAAALPQRLRALLLLVDNLALGPDGARAVEVWALAQLTERSEAAVLRDAEAMRGHRLAWVTAAEDPAVGLTTAGTAVARLLRSWKRQ